MNKYLYYGYCVLGIVLCAGVITKSKTDTVPVFIKRINYSESVGKHINF